MIYSIKRFSLSDHYEEHSDFLTASHEAGHFIFFIRGLKKSFGKSGAINFINNNPLYISMENRNNPNVLKRGGKRIAKFDYSGYKFPNQELNFNVDAGGPAIDIITKRKSKNQLLVIKLIEEDLIQIDSLYRKDPKSLKRGDDSKNMIEDLVHCNKYKGPEDTIRRINILSKSITSFELNIINEISEYISENLKTKKRVDLDLREYSLKLIEND